MVYRVGIRVLRLYWFVARPHTRGVKCVVRHDGRVLVVRHTYGDHGWDLPGGIAERDEDTELTVRRELREELGVSPVAVRLLRTMHWRPAGKHDEVSLFVVDLDDDALTLERAEIAAARWVSPDALPPGTTRQARAVIARSRWPHANDSASPPAGA